MSETCLVLRTCAADMTSAFGFVWPESGPVEAPDWEPTPECGHGLHGLLWGEGDGAVLNWAADARWLAVEVATADIVDLDGKCKFPRGVVVHCGDRFSATDYIAQHGGAGRAIVGGSATAGRKGTATAGDKGMAVAGDDGTLVLSFWDGSRRRLAVGYIGEDNLKAGVPYRLDGDGKFIEAGQEAGDE